MFPNFKRDLITTSEATICVRHAGSGPPVLLLHGFPQTHVLWHQIAPALAQEYTVVCADLRGYGDSSKPPTTPDHEPYSKRAMARDQVEIMQALGFEKLAVIGHDRGGRRRLPNGPGPPRAHPSRFGARHHSHQRDVS
jgi:haloacetate dehalogenase